MKTIKAGLTSWGQGRRRTRDDHLPPAASRRVMTSEWSSLWSCLSPAEILLWLFLETMFLGVPLVES